MTVAGTESNAGLNGNVKPNGAVSIAGLGLQTKAEKHEKVREITVKDLENFAVVKRNGMLVPFRRARIVRAIELAFRATKGIPVTAPLSQELYSTVESLTEQVIIAVATEAAKGACVTVEGIQDIVEVKLMQGGFYDVARNYIIYRDEHKGTRDDSPRGLKLLRRDGKTSVRFNPMKIASAVERGFRATLNIEGQTPDEVISAVNLITNKVVARAVQLVREGTALHVELIQDEVERQMMAEGHYKVAKDFILYRAERASLRSQDESGDQEVASAVDATVDGVVPGTIFTATSADGTSVSISEAELRRRITHASKGLEQLVSSEEILQESLRNFYEGIKLEEIDQATIMAARSKIEKDPAYSHVAARLLLDVIYREAMQTSAHATNLDKVHQEYFKTALKKGVSVERMAPELLQFDLDKLAKALKLDRDLEFAYLGLQTLYDRYLIHHEDVRLETPQIFWMRVAMGLSANEGEQKNERAIEFYDALSTFLFTSSTPTLFNAGTLHPQLSSCYLTTVMDDLQHIFKCVSDDAQLSKWAGGLGNDWTNVRATGARIKGTNGRSQGVIPFLKVANDTAVAVNQGGKRKGAMCAYLETWHLDIEDFLELRKNTGD
jgi:ribonucleoside-diphosphate reductase alpha chain